MNIRDLQYLLAVADYKHFGKAAEACFVSQPALSIQLKKLEKTLGVQLFERSNKKVMITEIGSDIVQRTRNIISEIQEIKKIAQASQNPFAGEIKLGLFPTLSPYLLPKIVPSIAKKYPNLVLLLIEEKTDILLEKLKRGLIDAALLALPVKGDFLECVDLFEDQFKVAVSPKHALSKKKEIDYSDLKNENLLLLEEGHCLREQALEFCSLAGTTENTNFKATSMETLRQMVLANFGITLMPKLTQQQNDGLVYLPFSDANLCRKIAMVWRKTSAKKAAYQSIAKTIKKLMA